MYVYSPTFIRNGCNSHPPAKPRILVGWPATQNMNFNNSLQSMNFYGGICLFGCLSFGKLMLWWPITVRFYTTPQHDFPGGSVSILRISKENSMDCNELSNFLNMPLFLSWPTDYMFTLHTGWKVVFYKAKYVRINKKNRSPSRQTPPKMEIFA